MGKVFNKINKMLDIINCITEVIISNDRQRCAKDLSASNSEVNGFNVIVDIATKEHCIKVCNSNTVHTNV